MSDPVICLHCGGVFDGTDDMEFPPCTCKHSPPPPSVQAESIECPCCGGHLRVGVRACPFCGCTVATQRCPSCTAWNLASAHHCSTCGKPIGVDALTDEQRSNLQCPRCTSTLTNRRYADLEVNECDRCGGLLIEPTMLDRIVETKDKVTGLHLALPRRSMVQETKVSYIPCPVCKKIMNRQVFGRLSGVIVDVCGSHGVWFDAGELAEVLTFVAKGGLERARQRKQDDLREELRAARSDAIRASFSQNLSQSGAIEGQRLFSSKASAGLDFVRTLLDIWRGLS